MDNNKDLVCLLFLIILPSFSGLESKASLISVVSTLCLTASPDDSSKIKRNL